MEDSDIVLVGAVASAVLQALKRTGLSSDLYGVVLIVLGAAIGSALAYGRAGTSAITDGAVKGIVAALAASGTYSAVKAMSHEQPRDARGRFIGRGDA